MRYSLPRRRRLGDPFASPKKIERLLDQLINALGSQLSSYIDLDTVRGKNYEPVVQLLQAASNFVRSQSGAKTYLGKPSRFPRELLSHVIEAMSRILNRESQGRISFRTFTDNNLRVLGCPDDIKHLLEDGEITLFEALQLKRLSSESLSVSQAQARAVRGEFLARCRRERWIAHRLRREIDMKLGKRMLGVENLAAAGSASEPNDNLAADLNYLSPLREDSLVSQQLALMMDLLQAVDTDNIEKADLDKLLYSIDEVLLQIQRIRRKQTITHSNERNPALGFL
jgi:hypothetical protein